MISFKKYTDIVGDIANKLKVTKDIAVNALIKAQERGINPLKWQRNISLLTTFAALVAEYDPTIDEVFVIKYKTRVYYSAGEKRYWSVKDTDVSNPKDAMKFKSEKDAQDELDGMERAQKGNYEIVKEEVEIEEKRARKKKVKLPPHLAKFFDKKGNPKPEVAARIRKARALKGVKITDVTPDWMFGEEVEEGYQEISNLVDITQEVMGKMIKAMKKDDFRTVTKLYRELGKIIK